MTDTNRPEAVHDVLRDMRQWKGDYSVFADRIERALSASASAKKCECWYDWHNGTHRPYCPRASAPETLRCKQCGNEWPDYLLSSGSCIKCKKATPPAHGDGEGVAEVLAKLPSLETLDAVDDDLRRGIRPCPLNNLTINDVKLLHRVLTTRPTPEAQEKE